MNSQKEKLRKETITFTIISKRIKFLRINLIKEVKNLFTEKYKTLMKEFENYINTENGKISHALVLE